MMTVKRTTNRTNAMPFRASKMPLRKLSSSFRVEKAYLVPCHFSSRKSFWVSWGSPRDQSATPSL